VHRYFITGTDTDVGKTRVAAALALALREAGLQPTIVKIVQTGVTAAGDGDAQRAARLAGVPFRELARFPKPADPWSAALAHGAPPLRAADLVTQLETIEGCLVAEGAGGVMVPLNECEQIGDVAARARLRAIIVVGMRLGCLNHALLTLEHCKRLRLPVAGAVLVDRWVHSDDDYRADVCRVLDGRARMLGVVGFAADEAASVAALAALFQPLVKTER
jgi:dethiobiotin synthetase